MRLAGDMPAPATLWDRADRVASVVFSTRRPLLPSPRHNGFGRLTRRQLRDAVDEFNGVRDADLVEVADGAPLHAASAEGMTIASRA
jgi:hypothetical protein